MSREMISSGIGYIGDMPMGWSIVPGKSMFDEVKNKNTDGTVTTALKFTYGEIVQKENFDASTEEYVADKIKSYNVVEPSDVVVNGLNLNYDFVSQRVAIVRENGVITSAYVVLRPKSHINPRYLNYHLKACDNMKVFHGMGEGIRQTIKFDDLGNMSLLCPDRETQDMIVRYLDSKCSTIDEAIERHKKIIEKLEEYRWAEIARLVSFKAENNTYETGNTWFPTLPYGISISRVGMHFDVTLGKMLCPKQRDENDTLEKYYCAGDIHFDGINQSNLKEMWFSPNEKRLYEVYNDDLLIVEGGAGAGNAFIVRNQEEKVYIQNSVLRIRGSETGSVRYLRYLIEHLVKHGYIAYACNTATFSHFTKDKVSGTPFPVSSFELQEKIANQIDSMDATVRSAQKKHEAVIEKLEEYRKSVIYNAVTGKLDCREAVK